MRTHDENWAIGKPFSTISAKRNEKGELQWKYGQYCYADGVVLIYQEPKLLSLSLYKNGRGYYRTIRGKTYTEIGMTRKAGEFAREISNVAVRP